MPPRAALLARDGTCSPTAPTAHVRGPRRVGADRRRDRPDPGRRASRASTSAASRRRRRSASAGSSAIFDDRLIGAPGRHAAGRNRACWRHTKPAQAAPVRTTISIPVQRAATAALGGRLGGVVAIKPRTGEVARLRRDRVLGPAAAGLDVQDHHHDRRPGEPRRQADDHVPVLVLRDAERRQAQQRRRRELRRDAGARVRRLVQLGVRAARRQGRGGATRRHGAAVRLQLADRHRRRGRESTIPAANDDRRRPRRRLVGDRPGPGPGDDASDGTRRGDDRVGGQAPEADADLARPPTAGQDDEA